jgi:hypothetical protein
MDEWMEVRRGGFNAVMKDRGCPSAASSTARRKRDGGPEVRPLILRRLRKKRSDAGDFDGKSFGAKVSDRSVGCRHIPGG